MTELKLKVQTGFFKRVAAIAMAVCLSVGMLPEAVSAENAAGKGTVESISITPNGPVELTEKGQTVTLTANVTYKDDASVTPSTPATPSTPSTPATPSTPSTPSTPVTDPQPMTKPAPATPVTPVSGQGQEEAVESVKAEMGQMDAAEITWTSSDKSIASVRGNGTNATVTAVKSGEAVITAKAGDKTASVKVTVTIEKEDVAVTEVKLNKTELVFDEIGAVQTLTATVKPDDAAGKTVTWSSDNEKVATVENGKVTSKGNGTAVITAKAGECTAKAAVTVSQKTTGVSILLNGQEIKGTLKAKVKKSYSLKAVVTPDDADAKNAKVTWSTSNSKTATVSATGKVKVKKAGTVTITAVTADGSKASVKFKCGKAAVKVKKLKISGTKKMKAKTSQTLTLTVSPATADNQKVTWKSSNKKVATVNGKGKVKAKKKGKATITATAKDGSRKKVTFKIEVK